MNKMLKAYEEYNQDILDKIKEIVNTVNEYVETNDIDLMIDFPKSYIDYDITFTVNKDAFMLNSIIPMLMTIFLMNTVS